MCTCVCALGFLMCSMRVGASTLARKRAHKHTLSERYVNMLERGAEVRKQRARKRGVALGHKANEQRTHTHTDRKRN